MAWSTSYVNIYGKQVNLQNYKSGLLLRYSHFSKGTVLRQRPGPLSTPWSKTKKREHDNRLECLRKTPFDFFVNVQDCLCCSSIGNQILLLFAVRVVREASGARHPGCWARQRVELAALAFCAQRWFGHFYSQIGQKELSARPARSLHSGRAWFSHSTTASTS